MNIYERRNNVLLLEGDKEFNEWSINLAKKQAEDQPMVYITIKKMAPAHSWIKDLELVAR